jgi:hypothetical protein
MATEQTNELSTTMGTLTMNESGFQPTNFEQAWRYATAMAKSNFVPERYRGKPEDCFIALDLAGKLSTPTFKVHWLTVLQSVYIVHGIPAMEAKLCIALVNRSGLFTDPLKYEVEGDNPKEKNYRVRAYATLKTSVTGIVLYGPWIDWELVRGEGWYDKTGSKWKTMPEVMFHYRAASWFKNRHCPEVTMGMMSTDEAWEIDERKSVDSVDITPPETGVAGLRAKLAKKSAVETNKTSQDDPESTTTPVVANPPQIKEFVAPPKANKRIKVAEKTAEPVVEPEKTEPVEEPHFDNEDFLLICLECRAAFDEPAVRFKGTSKEERVCPECLKPNYITMEDYRNQRGK